jgi:uncharacterized protein (DUF1330 family)
MAAYVIAELTVTDPTGFEEYRRGVESTIKQHGGRYLVRGGWSDTLEGAWRPSRVVVLEFPSVEAARRWYDSPEYAPLKALRMKTARTEALLIEGVPG